MSYADGTGPPSIPIIRCGCYRLVIDGVLEVHSVIKCINAYTIIFAILNYMDSFLISAVIIPLVGSGMVLGGLLSISIFQLPTIRRNMGREAVEQIYARIMDARMRLENTETFTIWQRKALSLQTVSQ